MEIYCPYCDHGFDLCHDDGAFYEDDGVEQEECPKCEKKFLVHSSLSWDFSGEKADCLNDGNHEWEQQSGAPKEAFIGRFRCKTCPKEERRDEEGRTKALKEIYG